MSLYAQKKERIIFQFDEKRDLLTETNNATIFKLNGVHTFRFVNGNHEKIDVNYHSVKNELTTYNTFIKLNKGKKYPEYFSEYSFYILLEIGENSSCLFEVEKIWTVEDKIVD